MTNLNKVILIGRLTKDAETTTIKETGVTICRFSFAINRDYYSKADGKKITDVTYVDSAIFGTFAESMCPYLKKGTLINIVGHLKTSTWLKNNSKQQRLDVVTDSLELLSGPRKGIDSSANQDNNSVQENTSNSSNENIDIDTANETAANITQPEIDSDYMYNTTQAAVYGDIF